MGMGGNGNELSGAIREWEWFFKCVNFGNGNGKDLAGTGEIGNTENHSGASLQAVSCASVGIQAWIASVPKSPRCRVQGA